jgi:5-methylcytosine-specific restriction endonuclease McrA
VSRRFLEKLEAARDALSHAKPGADAEAILEAGLDLILARQAKRRGQVEKPRRPRSDAKPTSAPVELATVPADVRRAVWARDQGRCQWRLDSGHICGSTHRLELDHIVLRSRGGPSTVENLRILCERHNKLAARLVLGERWMGRYLKPARERGAGQPRGEPAWRDGPAARRVPATPCHAATGSASR